MGGVHGEADHGAAAADRPGGAMLIELEKRKEPSRAMVYLTPLIAVAADHGWSARWSSRSSATTAAARSGRSSSRR